MAAAGRWLLSLTAAGLLGSVLASVMPEGPVKAVGLLACSLLLFLTALRPLTGLSWAQVEEQTAAFQAELKLTEAALGDSRQALYRSVIEQRSRTYSRDVTAGLDVTLEIRWDWSRQPPCPAGADVGGPLTREQREALVRRLTAELDLRPEDITFTDTEEEP